jgi:hypothetical protein
MLGESMSEFSPYLADLNQGAVPLADNDQLQRDQTSRMANRWQAFLERRRRKAVGRNPAVGIGMALRFGNEGGRLLASWASRALSKASRSQKSLQLEAEIEHSRADMQRYVMLAHYAINLAVRQDKDPVRRLSRKQHLMNRWRRLYQKPRQL